MNNLNDADTSIDNERRDFLVTATVTAGVLGIAGACWPLIRSMSPSDDLQAQASVEADLSGITPGSTLTVAWRGKPVFITRRTPAQVQAMEHSKGGKEPQADSTRVSNPEWLVVVGVCTHLGCIPNRSEDGWLCPCHGSHYDLSGRILEGPAPRNLEVPPYQFTSDSSIVIG